MIPCKLVCTENSMIDCPPNSIIVPGDAATWWHKLGPLLTKDNDLPFLDILGYLEDKDLEMSNSSLASLERVV